MSKQEKQVYDEGGRPTIKTERIVKKLEDAFKLDYNVTQACIYAGISRQNYYNWLEEDKEFFDRMQDAQEYTTMLAKKQHLKLLSKGDGAQVRFHLNAKGIDRETGEHEYKQQSHVENSGTIEVELTPEDEEAAEEFLTPPKTNGKKPTRKKVSQVAGKAKGNSKKSASSVDKKNARSEA